MKKRKENTWSAYQSVERLKTFVPLVDGTHIEEESSDADEHVIQDEDSEPPQVVKALDGRQ